MLSALEAVELHARLVDHNHGRAVYVLPIRLVFRDDGTSAKLPKVKWDRAASTRDGVDELWDLKQGGFMGVHLSRSGLILADQDVDAVPSELANLLAAHPTFTSESLSRGLPHYWYRAPVGHHPKDGRWMWAGTHVGDLKSKGIGVLGPIKADDDFALPPEDLLMSGSVVPPIAEGSLKHLVIAWLGYLDYPPTPEETLGWVAPQLRALANAQPGERNNLLYRAARDVAQVCAAGALTADEGLTVIWEAARQVFDEEELRLEVRQTISSAFEREVRA